MATETTMPADQMATGKKSFACWIPHIVRTLMGFGFFVFGLNGFLHFMPEPKELPAPVLSYMGALNSSNLFPVIMATQLTVGVFLLLNIFVPLALALIAPILVGIVMFHVSLAPEGTAPGVVFCVMELYLAWAYRSAFRPMLQFRTRPG